MDLVKYKGYEGTAELDMDRMVCFGKILFINDLVTYEAGSPSELQAAFEEAVEDYVETCHQLGKAPQKSLRGTFNVRIPSEMHRQAIRKAASMNVTLNEVVTQAIDRFVNDHVPGGVEPQLVVPEPGFQYVRTTGQASRGKWFGKGQTTGVGDN